MFCINCGTKLPDDAKFCYNCGNKVGGKLSPDESQVLKDEEKKLKEEKVNILNEYPKQEKTVSAKKEKEKTEIGFDIKRFIPIIGVGVIAVIFMVLLFFGWNMLFGKKNNGNSQGEYRFCLGCEIFGTSSYSFGTWQYVVCNICGRWRKCFSNFKFNAYAYSKK